MRFLLTAPHSSRNLWRLHDATFNILVPPPHNYSPCLTSAFSFPLQVLDLEVLCDGQFLDEDVPPSVVSMVDGCHDFFMDNPVEAQEHVRHRFCCQ
jgi:hypothetical protein